jgi:hypothetical protein
MRLPVLISFNNTVETCILLLSLFLAGCWRQFRWRESSPQLSNDGWEAGFEKLAAFGWIPLLKIEVAEFFPTVKRLVHSSPVPLSNFQRVCSQNGLKCILIPKGKESYYLLFKQLQWITSSHITMSEVSLHDWSLLTILVVYAICSWLGCIVYVSFSHFIHL